VEKQKSKNTDTETDSCYFTYKWLMNFALIDQHPDVIPVKGENEKK